MICVAKSATGKGLPSGRRARMVAFLIVLSGGVLTACGGSSGPEAPKAGTPQGYVRASTDQVSFAHPQQWPKLGEDAYPDGWPLAFGTDTAQVAVYVKLPQTTDAVLAAEAGIIGLRRSTQSFQVKKAREIDVPGAKEARRTDFTYRAGGSSGRSTETVQGTDITVVDGSGNACTVRVTGVADQLAENTIEQIAKTVEMK